jgi:hypothetical protein
MLKGREQHVWHEVDHGYTDASPVEERVHCPQPLRTNVGRGPVWPAKGHIRRRRRVGRFLSSQRSDSLRPERLDAIAIDVDVYALDEGEASKPFHLSKGQANTEVINLVSTEEDSAAQAFHFLRNQTVISDVRRHHQRHLTLAAGPCQRQEPAVVLEECRCVPRSMGRMPVPHRGNTQQGASGYGTKQETRGVHAVGSA